MSIETREFQMRLVDADERTVSGIAVPFNEDANIGGVYNERFVSGAIEDNPAGVKLFYQHEEPIGLVFEGRNEEDGYRITAKISETPRGEEVLTLLRDGVLDKFSVGFIPVESERDGNTVIRTKVELKEVSVVAFPAYEGASISEVREESSEATEDREASSNESQSKENSNMENIEMDVRAMGDEVAELRRLVEVGLHTAPSAPAFEHKFRSQGAYAKALAQGDADAVELFRAATTADSVLNPGWLGMINNLVDHGRPVVSAFSTAALPAEGLTVEYAKVVSNTMSVTAQAAELDPLTAGKVVIDSVSTAVKTFGGYSDMSRQVIERSSVPYLDTAFRAMTLAYAKAMNAYAKGIVTGLDYTGKTFDVSGGTYGDIAGGIADGAAYINELTGFTPEFILVSPDAYKFFVTVEGADARPVINVNGDGSNTFGTANIPGLRGSVFGLPLVVDYSLATGSAYLANSNAIQTLESAGAPVRLQDEDISTLSKSFSVYGYAAVTVPFEDAVVKLDITV